MTPWWLIGVCFSLMASFFGTLGKVLLKLGHNRVDDGTMDLEPSNNNSRRQQHISLILVGAMTCVIVINPVFDAISYIFAAQTVLAPMAGFSVVWNIILAPAILHEHLAPDDIRGMIWIIAGCFVVSCSGSHHTPDQTIAQVFLLFQQPVFLAYVLSNVTMCLVLGYVLATFPVYSNWRRFAFGALAGCVGGNLFLLKSAVELIRAQAWEHIETFCICIGALGSAAGGIYVLNLGLKEYDALYLVAVYETFLIVLGTSRRSCLSLNICPRCL